MARLERISYRAGLTPKEFHCLSMTRLMRVCVSHMEQEKAQWRRTATLGSFIINSGGLSQPKSPVKPQDLLPAVFPDGAGGGMSRERYNKNMERHYNRIRREQARKQRRADPSID